MRRVPRAGRRLAGGAHHPPEWKAVPNRERWEKYGFAPTKNLVGPHARLRRLPRRGRHPRGEPRPHRRRPPAAGVRGRPLTTSPTTTGNTGPKRAPPAEFEPRLWAVGQFAALRAATDLLRARAERADAAPWPEFSGLSCYACHHPVGDTPPLARGPRPVGVPGWEVWYNGAFATAAEFSPGPVRREAPDVGTPAGAAGKTMDGVTRPDPKAVAKLGRRRGEGTRRLAGDVCKTPTMPACPRSPPGCPRQARSAASPTAPRSDPDWDALAAHYLGLAAAYHAGGGAKGTAGGGPAGVPT